MAVDSACFKGCVITKNVNFFGLNNESLRRYIVMKYANVEDTCPTEINIINGKVSYDFSWFNYSRTAEFKMMVKVCDRSVETYEGIYKDKVSLNKLNYVRVESLSPDITSTVPTYFEVAITSLIVLGVLYAFYTIEGR